MKYILSICLSISLAVIVANSASADVCVVIDGSTADVVVTVSGSLDLTGAAPYVVNDPIASPGYTPGIVPSGSGWYVGPGAGQAHDSYFLTSVDVPFGTSTSFITPDSSSGDSFYLNGAGFVTENVGVNLGYVSGDPISSQMTFLNTSLADLTLTEGTYNFALPNDQIKMVITSVPEPTTATGFFFLSLIAFCRQRRR